MTAPAKVQDAPKVRELSELPTEAHALTTTTHARPAAVVEFDQAKLRLLADTILPGATGPDLDFFALICKRTGLDPFARQIHGIKRRVKVKVGNREEWQDRWSFQVAIDGFRLIAERTGKYRGQTIPLYCGPDQVWREVWIGEKPPVAAKVGVLRADFDQPLYAIALWGEYVQTNSDGQPVAMWKKMPAVMLAKVAEALALRKAFPQEMSGLYTDDEMAQADNPAGHEQRLAAQTTAGETAEGAPAPADPLPDPDTMTTEQALALVVKFGDVGRKPLGEYPVKTLEVARKWVAGKLEEDLDDASRERFERMAVAIPLVLAHLGRAQQEIPLDPPSSGDGPVPPTSASASPTTSAPASEPSPVTTPSTPPAASTATASAGNSASSPIASGPTTTKGSAEPDPDSVHALYHELNARLAQDDMPLEALAWFKQEIAGKHPQNERAIKRLHTMAGQCLRLGRALATTPLASPSAAAAAWEALRSGTAYTPETLEKLLLQVQGKVATGPLPVTPAAEPAA